MDSRKAAKGAKRPRSTTPTKGAGSASTDSSPRKKSKKTKNKTKRNRSNSDPTLKKKDKASTTATADGQMMAQMLSTFSKTEQSRFEAFTRASIDPATIGDWLAAVLANRHGVERQRRRLEDFVADGQASDICLVVGALAKIYAQRLVSEAVKARETPDEERALTAEELWTAHEQRVARGVDPGFFLQAQAAYMVRSDPKEHDQRRLAALAAQEAFDKHYGRSEPSDEMDVDSPEKKNEAGS